MKLILFLLWLGVVPAATRSEAGPSSRQVVATIDGQEILLEEILPRQEAVDGAFLVETGQGPRSERDPERLAEIRMRLQIEGLAFQFRERLRQAALNRFQVEASDEEIAAKKEEILNRTEIQRYEQENLALQERLIQALKSIQRGVSEREAFEDAGLNSETSFELFQLQVIEYGSPEKIRAIEEWLEKQRQEGIVNSPGWDVTARAELLSQKLNYRIDEEMAGTDEGIKRRLRELAPESVDAALRLLRQQDPAFVDQKRREWWLRQVSGADIEIFREDLKGAREALARWF